jgi:hypothetical protein
MFVYCISTNLRLLFLVFDILTIWQQFFSYLFHWEINLCSRNDHQYALICTTPLFYILAPTCFANSLPSSGSFLDPSELLEIQIEWVLCHVMCGYVACVPEWDGMTLQHIPHIIRYTTHFICISSNSERPKKLPDDGRLLPKHVGASIQNKGVVQSVHSVGYFY